MVAPLDAAFELRMTASLQRCTRPASASASASALSKRREPPNPKIEPVVVQELESYEWSRSDWARHAKQSKRMRRARQPRDERRARRNAEKASAREGVRGIHVVLHADREPRGTGSDAHSSLRGQTPTPLSG
eukprot:336982-Pleurochrysis_carterae.AAC.1